MIWTSGLSGRWIEGTVRGELLQEGWGAELGYAGVFKYDLTSRLVVERYLLSNARGKQSKYGEKITQRPSIWREWITR